MMDIQECRNSINTIKFICNMYAENNNGYGHNAGYRHVSKITGLSKNETCKLLTKGGDIHRQHTENRKQVIFYNEELLQIGLKAYNNIYNK